MYKVIESKARIFTRSRMMVGVGWVCNLGPHEESRPEVKCQLAQDHDKDGTSEVKTRTQDMRQECSKGKIVRVDMRQRARGDHRLFLFLDR